MSDASHDNGMLVELEMLSQPRLLAGARTLVGTIAQRLGFTEHECGQISLAVDEALCNVINHGYARREDGRIWLKVGELTDTDGRVGIRIVIQDRAAQVCPTTIKPRELDDIRPGGLGVHLIRQTMDEVTYELRDGGGMQLTMTRFHRPESEGQPPASEAMTHGKGESEHV